MSLKEYVAKLPTKRTLRVGVLDENAASVHPNSNGETVGNIAARNHYGAPGVPARPFLSITLAKNRAKIAKAGEMLLDNPDLLGAYVVGLVQETIADGVPPPNSPATIAAKGSDTPLIDTGILRQSITYEVE